jgi:uncharacterized protein YebE (UPF0316 family)
MTDYILAFIAMFLTDVFYTYYLKAVQGEQALRASSWATIIYIVAAFAIIEYNTNHLLLIPAALGAFCGTFVGMKIRKR